MAGLPTLPFTAPGLLKPAPELAELRASQRIARVRTETGDEAWLVTRYDDVRALLADPRLGRSHPEPEHAARMTHSVLFGGPRGDYENELSEATRMRSRLAGSFSRQRVQALAKPVGELVDTLIDRLVEAGTPQDLSSQFSFPLAVGVLAELFGVLETDRERLRTLLSDAIAKADSAEFGAAMGALVGGLVSMVAAKQAEPGEDLITDLAGEDDIVTTIVGLLFAGYEPLQERLDAGLLMLLAAPEQRDLLASDWDRLDGAVEEILRYMPSGDGGLPRYARARIEFAGVTVEPGELVILELAAANHDPARFTDPDAMNLARTAQPHVTFGHGPRYCIGAALSRVVLREAVRRLFSRLHNLQLAVPAEELGPRGNALVRERRPLPVIWW